jgi:hypothetical protein
VVGYGAESSLVVILVVHNIGVAVFEFEYDPPVAVNINGPVSIQLPAKRVKPIPRDIHVLDAGGGM